MNRPDRLGNPRRWAVFVSGMGALMLGIALSITAGLGVGSWQVFETGLMNVSGRSFAPVAIVESAILLVLAWVWLDQAPWIATGILAFAGLGIDVLLDVMSEPEAMSGRIALLLVGNALIAVGVAFYLASDFGASAQDAMFVGFYEMYSLRPAYVRFGLDGSLVVLGAILGGQFGIGTLVATIGIPTLIEPALRVGHRLADTPLPVALRPTGIPASADTT